MVGGAERATAAKSVAVQIQPRIKDARVVGGAERAAAAKSVAVINTRMMFTNHKSAPAKSAAVKHSTQGGVT